MKNEVTINYRADIDGLRAIAVVAVLLFHFFPKSLPGGFVGVDVFFVISGYLVTSIIYKNLLEESFSFSSFYYKRVKRLIPSLIVVSIFVTIGCSVLLLSDEFMNYGKHLFASSIFSSNIILFLESGYFDQSSDLKPLLHLWSLCVEEQYYLFWPLLMWGLYKFKRSWLLKILIALTCCSLLSCVFLTKRFPSFSFFLIPMRLWELGAGSLLVFFEGKELHKKIKWDLSYLGIVLIGWAIAELNKGKAFPGRWALLPVLGTVLIILAGNKGKINRILANKRIVYIGLISYPLYLWHWPLASLANIVSPTEPSLELMLGLFLVSFPLAAFTYEWLEKPLRKVRPTGFVTASILAGHLSLGLLGLFIWKNNGLDFRYPELEKTWKSKQSFASSIKTKESDLCRKEFIDVELCAISDIQQQPTVLLLGDSHANHLFPALKDHFNKKEENLLLLAKSGTAPLWGVVSKRNVDVSLDDILKYVSETPSIHTVIVSAFWSNYYEEDGVKFGIGKYKNVIQDTKNLDEKKQAVVFEQGLERTIKFLSKQNKKILLFQDVPFLPFNLNKCLHRPFIKPPKSCTLALENFLPQQEKSRLFIEKMAGKYKLTLLDPLNSICPSGICSIYNDGLLMYGDEHHLSISGSHIVMNNLLIPE